MVFQGRRGDGRSHRELAEGAALTAQPCRNPPNPTSPHTRRFLLQTAPRRGVQASHVRPVGSPRLAPWPLFTTRSRLNPSASMPCLRPPISEEP